MTDIQLITIVLTLLAILGSVYANRKSVEDMRDVLRAETQQQFVELKGETSVLRAELKAENGVLRAELKAENDVLRADTKQQFAELRSEMIATLQRIENKLDHVTEVQASHSERLGRLESK